MEITILPVMDYSHIDDGIALAQTIDSNVPRLFASPTGSGKTGLQRRIRKLDKFAKCYQLVPSVEIGAGFLDTWSLDPDAQQYAGIYTDTTFLNRLRSGEIDPRQVEGLLRDEAHHYDETNREIDEYLPNIKYRLGFTATPFRGTPQETKKLHDYYPIIHRLLSIPEAIRRRVISLPEFQVRPLLNDDTISVTAGEFSAKQVDKGYSSRIDDLLGIVSEFYDGTHFRQPITLVVASSAMVAKVAEVAPFPVVCVTQATSKADRQRAFDSAIARTHCLVQIRVVGEGVDLPLRIMVDAAPTMSPVLWLQRVGRITRPWDQQPVYICTNHNILRHGYLFEGAIPPAFFKEYKKQWPGWEPSARSMRRITGDVPGLSRFKPAQVPVIDGSTYFGFVIDDPTGRGHQYSCLADPSTDKCYLARRDWVLDELGNRDYTKKMRWRRIESLPDLAGYTSAPASVLTPGQANWWGNAARRVGLDPEAQVNARAFQFLPILLDLGVRVA